MIKIVTVLVILFLCASGGYANDGGYAQTSLLQPIDIDTVALDYERLFISKDGDDYVVEAELHLNSYQKTEETFFLGFEYIHEGLDYGEKDPTEFSPHILLVNGTSLQYEYRFDEERQISVLLYEATLKPGLNKIYHKYTVPQGVGTAEGFFHYILSTGARWKGNVIRDIEIFIKIEGEIIFFENSLRNFDIVGYGNRKGNTYYVHAGYLYTRLENYDASKDIIFSSYDREYYRWGIYYPYVFDEDFDRDRQNLDFHRILNTYVEMFSIDQYAEIRPDYIEVLQEQLRRCTSDELRVMRNTLYAQHGYVFQDRMLQELFESFYWYFPNPNMTVQQIEFSSEEMKVLNFILAMEEGQ